MTADGVELSIHETAHAGWRVLVVTGELDVYTRSALEARIAEAPADGAGLALDLTGVRFVDSSGLGTIVRAVHDDRRSGRATVLIAPPGSPVERLLELAGLLPTMRPLPDRTTL